jgi:hypothetical protein
MTSSAKRRADGVNGMGLAGRHDAGTIIIVSALRSTPSWSGQGGNSQDHALVQVDGVEIDRRLAAGLSTRLSAGDLHGVGGVGRALAFSFGLVAEESELHAAENSTQVAKPAASTCQGVKAPAEASSIQLWNSVISFLRFLRLVLLYVWLALVRTFSYIASACLLRLKPLRRGKQQLPVLVVSALAPSLSMPSSAEKSSSLLSGTR